MNHLIFGGSGFIGTHLKKYLLSLTLNEQKVYSYDIKKRIESDSLFLDVRTTFNLDIADVNDSIIYNLAGVHTTPGHEDYEYFETNILGARNICDFARIHSIETIVFTSSISIYGSSENIKTEEMLPMPDTPYGISKLTAEYIHQIWQSENPKKRKLIIVRPGVVFGQFENGNFSRLYALLKKRTFFYPGRKDTLKSCIYVKDVVRILYDTAINNPCEIKIFNLCYIPAPSIEEICNIITKVSGLKSPTIVLPGFMLKFFAEIVYFFSKLLNQKFNGIHPNRVGKLMVSTNIATNISNQGTYKLNYTLTEAIRDWFHDCGNVGLQ